MAGAHGRPLPDAGRHRTHFYGFYASRVRGSRRETDASDVQPTTNRRCSPSWARLISKVYQADPFVRSRCGHKMQMIAFLTDQLAIRRVLDHLGLGLPQEKPPALRELTLVPIDEASAPSPSLT